MHTIQKLCHTPIKVQFNSKSAGNILPKLVNQQKQWATIVVEVIKGILCRDSYSELSIKCFKFVELIAVKHPVQFQNMDTVVSKMQFHWLEDTYKMLNNQCFILFAVIYLANKLCLNIRCLTSKLVNLKQRWPLSSIWFNKYIEKQRINRILTLIFPFIVLISLTNLL